MIPIRRQILRHLTQAWIDDPRHPRRHPRHLRHLAGADIDHHLEMLECNQLIERDEGGRVAITAEGIRALARAAQRI